MHWGKISLSLYYSVCKKRFYGKEMNQNNVPYFSLRGPDSSSPVSFNLYPSLIHNAFNHTVSGEEKASCLRWESDLSPVTFHLSDPTGIIPWNATPGKACGATLGNICNTSEVRGYWPGPLFFFFYLSCALTNSLFFIHSSTCPTISTLLH